MKNKSIDLNDHLFAQIERLSEEGLKGDALKDEIERSKAMSTVASKVIENAQLNLEAKKLLGNGIIRTVPEMIASDKK